MASGIPLVEYKKEAFEMFEDLMQDIQSTFTERYLKIQVNADGPPPPPPPPPMVASGPREPSSDDLFSRRGQSSRRRRASRPGLATLGAPMPGAAEVGRNDPCPCGSGKKYKKCHGAA